MGGDATGQGGVIVDVEFEKVEERIIYSFESAVYICDCKPQRLSLGTEEECAFLNAKV